MCLLKCKQALISLTSELTKMKNLFALLLAFIGFFANVHAQSANLSIQGVLRNSNGTAVENGQYELTFKLYLEESTGTALWEETIPEVDVEGGIYSVVLGSITTLDAAFDQPYFLGVSIEGGSELIPRARLTSSPYALSLIGDDNIFPNSGNVGVGAASPQHKLTVQVGNGTLGLDAEEDANNAAVITSVSSGLRFNAGGMDKDFDFEEGDVRLNNGDVRLNNGDIRLGDGNLLLENGKFIFSDEANSPSEVASLELDIANGNDLILSNTIGNTNIEGNKIVLNSSAGAIEINREGEGLHLKGTDSTFITLTAQSGTNANARFGFFENDSLKLETEGQDIVINAKGGTTRVMNTLEVGKNGVNTYTQALWGSYMSRWSHDGDDIKYVGSGHVDESAIWAYDDIAAKLFKAISDKRIKKDFKISNAEHDLKTLKQIEVTDYRHIDEIKEGTAFRKGLIAQQVKSVFPEAVFSSTNYIPNVYSLSSQVTTKGDAVTITLAKPHGLKVNDRVRIIGEKGEENVVVKNVINEKSFTVVSKNINGTDKVFVYGKEVDDFHTVDYDRVFTLAVSATQELARKVEKLERENALLKSNAAKVNDILKTLEAKIEALGSISVLTGSK